MHPIDNKTRLNSTLFTYISSGGPDYYLAKETSEAKELWIINKDAFFNIPHGDRYTLFLNQLYTNYFLLDVNMLSRKKGCIVTFSTTKDFSFSLTRYGNKPKDVGGDVYLSKNAENWGKGTVRNLEKYFEGYDDNKVLHFQFYIYKPNTYQYYVDLEVVDPDTIEKFITADEEDVIDKIYYLYITNT